MRTLALQSLDDATFALAPTGRRRAAVLLARAALASLLACAGVQAQDGVPCTAIVNDAERLACYDRALRATPPPPAATRPAAAAPAAAAPAAAAPTAVARPARPAAAAPPSAAVESAAPATVQLVIVGVRALPGRGATFTTEDGQVWVQTDTQRLTYPTVPFTAELKPGAMGSSFLVPKDRRAVRVRRQRE